MKKNKIVLYRFIIVIIALQIALCSFIKASEQTVQLHTTTESTSAINIPFTEALQTIQNVGNCYFFARNVYKFGQNTNKFLNPSQERQNQIQNIQEQSQLINLKKKFVTCLVESRANIKKGSLGIPCECEQAAFLLGSAGAVNEVERMVIAFKILNK
jgi:hypothetical protein